MMKSATLFQAKGIGCPVPFWINCLLLVVLLTASSCSSNLFYLPGSYSSPHHFRLLHDPSLLHIRYEIDEQPQTAFYLGSSAHPPQQVWVLLSGIDSLALDWLQWFGPVSGDDIGFLLIDYPGYGLNEGVPREERMIRGGIRAIDGLLEFFGTSRAKMQFQLNILGHSLGSGVAIQIADRIPVDRLLLISPFTSMHELLQFRYGWLQGLLISLILPERYPNRETLARLARQPTAPEIHIVHGKSDGVIPVAMARALARASGNTAKLHIIDGMGHRNMFARYGDLITTIVTDPAKPTP